MSKLNRTYIHLINLLIFHLLFFVNVSVAQEMNGGTKNRWVAIVSLSDGKALSFSRKDLREVEKWNPLESEKKLPKTTDEILAILLGNLRERYDGYKISAPVGLSLKQVVADGTVLENYVWVLEGFVVPLNNEGGVEKVYAAALVDGKLATVR